jgi:5-methylcytosine-specific restriction endonuclease McrA
MRKYYIENRERIKAKAKRYYAENRDAVADRRRTNPKSLYSIIRRNARNRSIDFPLLLEDFVSWFLESKKVCRYCGIPVERLRVVDKSKKMAKRLSIDRIDNNRGYEIDNIALACMLCNFIKSNIFTGDEMMEIGKKYIRPKWQLSE